MPAMALFEGHLLIPRYILQSLAQVCTALQDKPFVTKSTGDDIATIRRSVQKKRKHLMAKEEIMYKNIIKGGGEM